MDITDVTLREITQVPNRSYTASQRIEAGKRLDGLAVDTIQAGFAITGEDERAVISSLATQCDATVSSLARARSEDVSAALAAGAELIDIFAPLSDLQLTHTVQTSRAAMLENVEDAIHDARDAGTAVRLSVLDAFRTDPEIVADALTSLPGVTVAGLADTVGARTPLSVRRYLEALFERGIDPGSIGVHFHDDVGMATANALVASEMGVGTADVSVAGLGERTGNTALEQLVVAGVLERDTNFGIREDALIPSCREVLDALGEEIDTQTPILGTAATTHEAGIHTAAMLSEPSVMEPFDPADFGGERVLLFGSQTGRRGAKQLLERAGKEPTPALIERLLERLADEGPIDQSRAVDLAATL